MKGNVVDLFYVTTISDITKKPSFGLLLFFALHLSGSIVVVLLAHPRVSLVIYGQGDLSL